MLFFILRLLSGREYRNVSISDLGYLLQKGGGSFLRGILWSLVRLRRPRGLMLGRNVKLIGAGRLFLGRGVSLGRNSYFECSSDQGVTLGNGVTIREYAWLQCRSGLNAAAGKVSIGEGSYIGPFAVLGAGGDVVIGPRCQIGARFTVSAESHERDERNTFVQGKVSRRGIEIGSECWIGNNVCVLDGVRIGARCVIGAGSVVTRDVPGGSTAYGVPARVRSTGS
jgi:acetyltransferase-like isoleucine patch superfamily enzyme